MTVQSPRKQTNSSKGRGKHKRRQATESKSSTKWADRCMYAELLEMKDEHQWMTSPDGVLEDGLPSDLETGWVAVGKSMSISIPRRG